MATLTPASHLTPHRIEVRAHEAGWRWSVVGDREVATGAAPNDVAADRCAQVAAGVLLSLGRIGRRRF